jgi:dTMP kinase
MSHNSRGAFIVIEGCDGCGKTTQITMLLNYLKGIGKQVELLRYPSTLFENKLIQYPYKFSNVDRTTPIGQIIDSYLSKELEMDDRAIHLLFSANRWESV